MWVLIPSYEPDARLLELVASLSRWASVLVVDDGSGDAYAELFAASDRLGAVVLHHEDNRGKAAALRTGFAWLAERVRCDAVVCADGDGQHQPRDIERVALRALKRVADGESDGIVLGAREFTGDVPLRSRVGNRATSALVAAVTGRRMVDTQTGLRAYPTSLLPWLLKVRGERFAYELRMLLDASRAGMPIVEVPIATVYEGRNAQSHFRPLRDSLSVLLPVVLFAGSSLVAFGVDTIALLALNAITGSLAAAIIGARLLSATVNFTLNRRAVFRSAGPIAPQIARYAALAGSLLLASYLGLWMLTLWSVPLLPAKLIVDLTLCAASFAIQRTFVFAHGRPRVSAPDSVEVAARG